MNDDIAVRKPELPTPPAVSVRTPTFEIQFVHNQYGAHFWRECVVSESTNERRLVFFANVHAPLETICVAALWSDLFEVRITRKP